MMDEAIQLLLVLCIFLIGQDHKDEEAAEQPSQNECDNATGEREEFHPTYRRKNKARQ
jgi:hypothetical protein